MTDPPDLPGRPGPPATAEPPRPASPAGARIALRLPLGTEQPVSPLELFFDLVFVFAITQVTTLLSERPTWDGLLQGLAVLALLWWAWSSYAWLTNSVDPEHGPARLAVFGAMGAFMIVALAVPGAFGADALVFALAYATVRVLHLVLYLLAARDEPALRGAIVRLARPAVVASALILLAAVIGDGARAPLWGTALLADWAGLALTGVAGWRVHAGHFAERHANIIIIALGESVVDIGLGAHGHVLNGPLVGAALLGLTIAAMLWWAYFDVVALVAGRVFRAARDEAQVRMARDSYTYLHFAMVAGIVLFAFGVKQVLVGLDRSLAPLPATCLGGGLALYLAGHIAFRLRNVHSLNRQRCAAAAACLATIALARVVPAIATLGVCTAIWVALIAFEVLHFADARARVRAEN
jgi:low temperature requirement protein LtrA